MHGEFFDAGNATNLSKGQRLIRFSPASPLLLAVVWALLVMVSYTSLPPDEALAATWPVAESRLSASLGFHEQYSAGTKQKSYVHSGIDATASAGSQIFSPIAGTVSFTGSVPSGDSMLNGGGQGQTMRGVSVKMADGRTVTLMPFETVNVKRGEQVAEGAVLGTLAARGDRSSAHPHVHMGLKRGSTYYDPMTLFGLTSTPHALPAAQESAASAPHPATSAVSAAQVPARTAQAAQAPQTASGFEPLSAPSASGVAAEVPATLPASAAQLAAQGEGQTGKTQVEVQEPAASLNSTQAGVQLEHSTAQQGSDPGAQASGKSQGSQANVDDESFSSIESGASAQLVRRTPEGGLGVQLADAASALARGLYTMCADQASSLAGGLASAAAGLGCSSVFLAVVLGCAVTVLVACVVHLVRSAVAAQSVSQARRIIGQAKLHLVRQKAG